MYVGTSQTNLNSNDANQLVAFLTIYAALYLLSAEVCVDVVVLTTVLENSVGGRIARVVAVVNLPLVFNSRSQGVL